MEDLELAIRLGVPIALLLVTYAIGTWIEKRHFDDLRRRERLYRPRMPTMTFAALPEGWTADRSGLVLGSVVVSLDYFKRFLAGLRAIVGGATGSRLCGEPSSMSSPSPAVS